MTTQEFLQAVQRTAAASPVYREGGTGADGTCDCIGLIMGAMYACGHPAYDMHSSNYFARYQTVQLEAIRSQESLQEGMIVYKARIGATTLHERYLPGGRYHTGDFNDYYHAGVVESVDPFTIVHCTSAGNISGIVRDHVLSGWTHCGFADGLSVAPSAVTSAVIMAPSGKTVNLRRHPRRDGALLSRLPLGSRVTVCEKADGWVRVTVNGLTGYVMECFLRSDSLETDWVRLPRSAVLGMIETLRACALADEKEENV